MTDIDPLAPIAPSPPKAAFAEDFVDIFVSPREVFARRADSGFFLVMLIVTLLLGGFFLVNRGSMESIMDAEFAKGMALAAKQNPSMTEAQIASAKKIAGYSMNIGAFVLVPIMTLCIGLGAWLTAKILGGRLSYSTATMIAAYSYMPRVLESLGVSAQGLLLDTSGMTNRYQMSFGVARFLSPDLSPGLLGLAGRVDVFTIWVTVLLAIGIVTLAKLPKDKAIAAGAIMWVFGALPSLWALIRA